MNHLSEEGGRVSQNNRTSAQEGRRVSFPRGPSPLICTAVVIRYGK